MSFNTTTYNASSVAFNTEHPVYIDGSTATIPINGSTYYGGAFGKVMCAFAVDGGDSVLGGNAIVSGALTAYGSASVAGALALGSSITANIPTSTIASLNTYTLIYPIPFTTSITNASFTTPAISTDSYTGATTSNITGWTFSGSFGCYQSNGQSPFNNSTYPTGCTQSICIQFNGSYTGMNFYQTITIGAVRTYTISFYARGRPTGSQTYFNTGQIGTLSINGNSVSTTGLTQGAGWVLYSFTSTITVGSYPLNFNVAGGSGDTTICFTGITIV